LIKRFGWFETKGAVYKRRPQSRRRVDLSCLDKRVRGFFRCRRSNFFLQNIQVFRKLWYGRTDGGRRGWGNADKLRKRGQFSWFCAGTSFM